MPQDALSNASQNEAAYEAVRQRSVGVEDAILGEEGGAVSATEFARRSNLRHQLIDAYRDAGTIIAVQHRGTWHYPLWQIHNGALLTGLDVVLQALHARDRRGWDALDWLLTPAEALDHRRPLDLLREGGEMEALLLHVERCAL